MSCLIENPLMVPVGAREMPRYVERRLQQRAGEVGALHGSLRASPHTSAVLFLLGSRAIGGGRTETCLILNKRSQKVRQPGDLCCPGGGIVPWLDACLARLLRFKGSPLSYWSDWKVWRKRRTNDAFNLSLLLATGLRESFEEMRLNPLAVRFLGALPPQKLVMFHREIYPFVCWVTRQRRFHPNWEVEKIITIPLSCLLNPDNYARYRLEIDLMINRRNVLPRSETKEFPCFLHRQGGQTERLWGATFRITMIFLEWVFGFKPPEMEYLQTVDGRLDRNYTEGRV